MRKRTAFGVGFFLGPAVTGYLAGYGLTAPIYFAAGLSMTSILFTTFLLPGGKPPAKLADSGAPGPGGRRLSVFEWSAYLEYLRRPALARGFGDMIGRRA